MVAKSCHRDFVIFSAFSFYKLIVLVISFYSKNNLKWKWKEIKTFLKLIEINLKAKSIESKWN